MSIIFTYEQMPCSFCLLKFFFFFFFMQKIVYVKKEAGFSVVVALPNISGFQRFDGFSFEICTFAKSICSPNVTISNSEHATCVLCITKLKQTKKW